MSSEYYRNEIAKFKKRGFICVLLLLIPIYFLIKWQNEHDEHFEAEFQYYHYCNELIVKYKLPYEYGWQVDEESLEGVRMEEDDRVKFFQYLKNKDDNPDPSSGERLVYYVSIVIISLAIGYYLIRILIAKLDMDASLKDEQERKAKALQEKEYNDNCLKLYTELKKIGITKMGDINEKNKEEFEDVKSRIYYFSGKDLEEIIKAMKIGKTEYDKLHPPKKTAEEKEKENRYKLAMERREFYRKLSGMEIYTQSDVEGYAVLNGIPKDKAWTDYEEGKELDRKRLEGELKQAKRDASDTYNSLFGLPKTCPNCGKPAQWFGNMSEQSTRKDTSFSHTSPMYLNAGTYVHMKTTETKITKYKCPNCGFVLTRES